MNKKEEIESSFDEKFSTALYRAWKGDGRIEALDGGNPATEIKSFYAAKISQLLESVVPEEKMTGTFKDDGLVASGFNKAVRMMRDNTIKTGF